jgi:ubiquitin C-terminal hydrolase
LTRNRQNLNSVVNFLLLLLVTHHNINHSNGMMIQLQLKDDAERLEHGRRLRKFSRVSNNNNNNNNKTTTITTITTLESERAIFHSYSHTHTRLATTFGKRAPHETTDGKRDKKCPVFYSIS